MKNLLKKARTVLFRIEHRVPYIPDFNDAWNILKILLMSFFICVIYSFSQVSKASLFYATFWVTLQEFSPYLISQLLLLILNAKIIKKLHPINAILYLIALNFLTIYLVSSIFIHSYDGMFLEIDEAVAKFALSFGILFFFLIYFDWRERNLHPSQLQAQLSFLQSKMRPHFLFNTINSIVSLIKKDPNTAKKMLLNLSELLRASLKEDNTFMHKLSQEIKLCQKYLEIEKMRLGDRLEVIWEIDENIDNAIFPKLSIQPLIENSVLHGIQKLEEGGVINIKISKSTQSRLIIDISNPIPLEKIGLIDEDSHNNISMANLIERLKICFDGDISFKTSKTDDKFNIYLETPLKSS